MSTLKYILLFSFLISCKKFVSIDPPRTQLVTATVFNNENSAIAAVAGLYEQMMEDFRSLSNGGITLYTGLSADELQHFGNTTDYLEFQSNNLSAANSSVKNYLWAKGFNFIYLANAILEGLDQSPHVSAALKQQLMGEAKGIRAFNMAYLTGLFGDLPIASTTDYRKNATLSRSPKTEVYQLILADLISSDALLSAGASAPDRLHMNKWATKALLARIYLYIGDWINAEKYAGLVINSSNFFLESDLNKVFLPESNEAIWQLLPVAENQNTGDGYMFAQASGTPTYAGLTPQLLSAFEQGDARKSSWTKSYLSSAQTFTVPYKYKIQFSTTVSEHNTVLRLAEQFLIRAEARTQLSNLSGAQSDLNRIRQRAGLSATAAADKTSLLLAIEQERRVELFAEWGHRWLDLQRTGRANTVLTPLKPNWSENDMLYPLPQTEIINNPQLVQNPGY